MICVHEPELWSVNRTLDGKGIFIQVRCEFCGAIYGFRGVPAGASPNAPTRSVDGRELTLPLLTPDELGRQGLSAGTQDDPPLVTGPGFTEPLDLSNVREGEVDVVFEDDGTLHNVLIAEDY